jgi:hypothetical protein
MDSPGLIVLIFPNPLKKATIDPTLNKTETYQPAMKSAPCGHPFAAGARQNSARLQKTPMKWELWIGATPICAKRQHLTSAVGRVSPSAPRANRGGSQTLAITSEQLC